MTAIFLAFLLIGVSAFGGGMVTISLIYYEIVDKNSWISPRRMNNIITIAQLTPGPISINSATFVGFTLHGILGSALATLAVILPSLIIMTAYVQLSKRLHNRIDKNITYRFKNSIKPAILSLLAYAVFVFARNSEADIPFMIMSAGCFGTLLFLKKIHPVILFIACGVAGVLLYG